MQKPNKTKDKLEPTKVIVPFKKDGWYCFKVVELPPGGIDEGKELFVTEPDIFSCFVDQLVNKTREHFGI